MKSKLFDVVIFEMKTRKIEAVIGTNMSEGKAENREITGLNRINIEHYSTETVPAGKYKKGDTLK